MSHHLRLARGGVLRPSLRRAPAAPDGNARWDYPDGVDLSRLRGRVPAVALVLIALVCLGLLGFACACLVDDPAAAIASVLEGIAAAPALVAAWPLVVAAIGGAAGLLAVAAATARARSPAALQRFLL